MIDKIYRCEICRDKCESGNRIKFVTGGEAILLCPFNDGSASEVIICDGCQKMLKEATFKEPRQYSTSPST